MSGEEHLLEVQGIRLEVVRKTVKNLHLRVYPPGDRVRLTVPRHLSEAAIRRIVADKLSWIRRQQARLARQPAAQPHTMSSGETHLFLGRAFRLQVLEGGRPGVRVRDESVLELRVRPDVDSARRGAILDRWYRSELQALLPGIIAKWEPVLDVSVAEWGIRKMKTRWGTCNISARRIWLNLELIKRPLPCLEYVVVHEMIHLLERYHNRRFWALMDRFLPDWRRHRDALKGK